MKQRNLDPADRIEVMAWRVSRRSSAPADLVYVLALWGLAAFVAVLGVVCW